MMYTYFGDKENTAGGQIWVEIMWTGWLLDGMDSVIYALVLEWLGFLLSTFGLLVFFFRTLQRQSWLVVVTGSLATSLLSYLVFKTWLGVNLPGGLLGF